MDYPDDPDWEAMGGTGGTPQVSGTLGYNRLGLPAGVHLSVGEPGSLTPLYQVPIVRSIAYDANRLPRRIDYGDDAVIGALHTEMSYDERLRPVRSRTMRRADPNAQGERPLNGVTTVHDFRYTWDAVSNLIEVTDARIASEWPAGYRPWRQTVGHDALYRVNRIDFAYMNDAGAFTDAGDAATNWRTERTRPNLDGSTHEQSDPMHRRPAPMVSQNGEQRVNQLLYDYDWLANQTDWHDDQGVFYERAAGNLSSGNDDIGFDAENPASRPSALYLSTNIREAPATGVANTDHGGYVWLDYGDDGNVVQMTVHGRCQDRNPNSTNENRICAVPTTGSLESRRAALDTRCRCQVEQHYRYDWDELNRLSEARRYDRQGATGRWNLMVQQRYRYDAGNVRMIKETINPGADGEPFAATTLQPYPGDYERRGLELDFQGRTYEANTALGTETQYLVGDARLVWGAHERGSSNLTREQRLTLPLSDLVQSTAAVVDLQSGALVEHTTFYPNGARETHRTTRDASLQLEPVGFTGKEADEEVGLVYFGERYLIPTLGRWASVDPLSAHQVGGGEALNGYHYISGSLLQGRDPLGLCGDDHTMASWWDCMGVFAPAGWILDNTIFAVARGANESSRRARRHGASSNQAALVGVAHIVVGVFGADEIPEAANAADDVRAAGVGGGRGFRLLIAVTIGGAGGTLVRGGARLTRAGRASISAAVDTLGEALTRRGMANAHTPNVLPSPRGGTSPRGTGSTSRLSSLSRLAFHLRRLNPRHRASQTTIALGIGANESGQAVLYAAQPRGQEFTDIQIAELEILAAEAGAQLRVLGAREVIDESLAAASSVLTTAHHAEVRLAGQAAADNVSLGQVATDNYRCRDCSDAYDTGSVRDLHPDVEFVSPSHKAERSDRESLLRFGVKDVYE
ncbi:MAG: RHS repeat-associated core domain-containing protein [Polyangiales bacterium]